MNQIAHQIGFLGPQPDGMLCRKFPLQSIKSDTACGQNDSAASSPDDRVDPCDEFVKGKRFGDIVVSTEIETRDLIVDIIACGQKNGRRMYPFLAHSLERFRSAHDRHHDIQQHTVISCFPYHGKRITSVLRTTY